MKSKALLLRRDLQPLAFHCALAVMFPGRAFSNEPDFDRAWQIMRGFFPRVIAATLMPDHLHIIADPIASLSQFQLRQKMSFLRRELMRVFPAISWEPVSAPPPIMNVEKLRRDVRYIHLNPCREGLCRDPLEWKWSTHRDYFNLNSNPQVDVTSAIRLLGYPVTPKGLSEFHKYISSDPSVHPIGTPVPADPGKCEILNLGAAEIAAATAIRTAYSAFRVKGKLRSQLMRVLHLEFGVTRAKVARHFGVDAKAVALRPMTEEDRALAKAVRMTLNDPRLMPRR